MTTWTNTNKISLLYKDDGALLLIDSGYGIIPETTSIGDVWEKSDKNSATFSNPSRTSASWSNTSKS